MSRQAFTTCSTLAEGCVLYQESGRINTWGAGRYYDGTTCWVVNSSGVITGTSTCVPLAIISIGTNDSAYISMSIGSILVNAVNVTDITGVNPNTPGNGGQVKTTQIGTYTVEVPYSASTGGERITLTDSANVSQCYGTSTGSGTATFYSVTINTSVDLYLVALSGVCV